MSIATRVTGRTTSKGKRLVIDTDLHAILKVEAVTQDTSLAEVTRVVLCQGLNRDPRTLKPLNGGVLESND